jgi:mannose/cellobiose epimerase-like protein (N-acyl-D-glucosamine 2-epimerase family)
LVYEVLKRMTQDEDKGMGGEASASEFEEGEVQAAVPLSADAMMAWDGVPKKRAERRREKRRRTRPGRGRRR